MSVSTGWWRLVLCEWSVCGGVETEVVEASVGQWQSGMDESGRYSYIAKLYDFSTFLCTFSARIFHALSYAPCTLHPV